MSALPPSVIRQKGDAVEGRVVSQAAMLLDVPVTRADISELAWLRDDLRAGSLPVGSVEFVRQAMAVAGVAEPEPMSYPPVLEPLLRRRVELTTIERVRGTKFIKPVVTKLFTGFVWEASASDASYSEHDREQLEAMRMLSPMTPVWTADPVHFLCEWRYYVCRGQVLGAARYDPAGDDDAPAPDGAVLREAIQRLTDAPTSPVAYALDLGALSTGETALVEANDAWALGLYGRSLDAKAYLQLLSERWRQICNQAAPSAVPEFATNPTGRCSRPKHGSQ